MGFVDGIGIDFGGYLSIFSASPSIHTVPYLVAILLYREIEHDHESLILPNHAEAMFRQTHRFGGLHNHGSDMFRQRDTSSLIQWVRVVVGLCIMSTFVSKSKPSLIGINW